MEGMKTSYKNLLNEIQLTDDEHKNNFNTESVIYHFTIFHLIYICIYSIHKTCSNSNEITENISPNAVTVLLKVS